MATPTEPVAAADLAAVEAQLGRAPRGTHAVGHRCPCRHPDVVVTEPRLPDGTPFPTTYYLTCPRAASLIGTLEGSGVMREMEARLAEDADLATAYAAAHLAYLAARAELGDVPEIDRVSAGGMPDRVKCLHALAAPGPRRRAGREPPRRRGGGASRRLVGRGPLCLRSPPSTAAPTPSSC